MFFKKCPMKPTLSCIIILLFLSSCLTQKKCLVIKDKTACKISEKQYQYFVDVLENTYMLENEPQLFNLFLNDLFTVYKKGDVNLLAHTAISFRQDREKLEAVNLLLKIRDMQHYYYFYPERIFWKIEKINAQDSLSNNKGFAARDFPNNYFESYESLTPFPYIFTFGNEEQPLISGIQLFEGIRFIHDLKKVDSKTTSYILESIDNSHGVYFFPLAAFIVNNAKDEIERPEIRRVLSIIYWKLLCLNADVDF